MASNNNNNNNNNNKNTPRVLTTNELRRLRDCAEENDTLARCWSQENVAIMAMEWTPMAFRTTWTSHISCNEVRGRWQNQNRAGVLIVSTLEPSTRCKSNDKSSQNRKPQFQEHRYWATPRLFGVPESGSKTTAEGVTSCAPRVKTGVIISKLFSKLSETYGTICVCSHRPKLLIEGFEEDIEFAMPKGVQLVDLIKVLEYQSFTEGVPEELQEYVRCSLDVDPRSGRFEEMPDGPADPSERYSEFTANEPKWGAQGDILNYMRRPGDVSAGTVLSVVGPKAELHRRDIDRLESESIALERALKGMTKEEIKDARRRAKRESQQRVS